jgi:anti-sigma factor RsiW
MIGAYKNRRKSSADKVDELLSAYLDDMLALDERASLEARLQQEPTLLARLESLRQTKKVLAGLPQVGVPRNFILSPAMVSAPRPAARPRRQRTWPVFGWATAAIALVFLLVFAGDVFVVAPSVRAPAEPAAVEETKLSMESVADALEMAPTLFEAPAEGLVDKEAEPAAEMPPVAVERETLAEKVIEEITLPESEAPTIVAESQPAPAEEAPVAEKIAEPTPAVGAGYEQPPAGEQSEMMLQTAASATAEARTALSQETPFGKEAPAPVVEVTVEVELDEAMAVAPQTPSAVTQEMPPTPSLEQGTSDDRAISQAQQAATLEAVPVVPLQLTPDAADTSQDADRVLSILRFVEIGLGIGIVCLAGVTLILRRRGI